MNTSIHSLPTFGKTSTRKALATGAVALGFLTSGVSAGAASAYQEQQQAAEHSYTRCTDTAERVNQLIEPSQRLVPEEYCKKDADAAENAKNKKNAASAVGGAGFLAIILGIIGSFPGRKGSE